MTLCISLTGFPTAPSRLKNLSAMSLSENPSENPPFRVREYRPSDFPQLCAIDRLCFSEAIAYTPEEIALGLAQPGAFAIVAEAQDAEQQDQVIAFVLAQEKRRRLG